MNNDDSAQDVFNHQSWVGNTSISKEEISLILNELSRKSLNLFKKRELLVSQKTRVDSDLKTTENEIKQINERLGYITKNDKRVSVSLKKQKSKQYIKGRFWWEGKQRDVQIGSEKSVLSFIKVLEKNKVVNKLRLGKEHYLDWNTIQDNKHVLEAIQKIGGIKAAGYILNKVKESNSKPKKETEKINKQDSLSSVTSIKKEKKELDWYESWKNENFIKV
ncbi:MAG: hypothetical protein CMG69_00485 [Candidatus Marinimicrobia bacterium]|nr:hypothetical protein [Candidatus Neomarinimicrobiota bacterium]|tara:strand:- start:192 stop:851 length:660 start_codon:yes stop_codon:yes gene_type:complete